MMRVEDFAVGVIGLIGKDEAYNEAFNVCGDETPSFNEVLDVLSELTGKKVKTIDITSDFYAKELPSRAGEILGGRSIDRFNSNDKIKAVVPLFRHTISLRKGIEMTYNAYRDNHYQFGIDWEFEGDTDRIILKWCKKNRINTDGLNLHFIDYLGDADSSDKRKYIFALHRGRWDVWVMMFGFRVVKKVKRILLGK